MQFWFELVPTQRIVADKAEAKESFEKLLQALASVGLAIEIRNGDNCSLLVFVKVASDKRMNQAVYRSRCVLRSLPAS